MENQSTLFGVYNNITYFIVDYKSEDQFQAACVKWFDETFYNHRRMLFAIPNGGARDGRTASILNATGVRPGVADLCLVLPEGKVVWIEMKLPNGRQSPDQVSWEAMLDEREHLYLVVRSMEDFKQLILQFLFIPR